ncbi:hypothetical protein Vretifemale_13616 [Volvox reticuliferus]|nr:hypothetical protein Vretifemale_13616 [Volvox reticuliferus]
MAFDLETLYELHYQSITLGKVFCQKRAPNCDSCPLAPQCDYALQGGQRLKKHAVVLQPPQPPPRESPLSPQHRKTQHPQRKQLKQPVAPADASTVSYASRTTTRLTKRSRSSRTQVDYAEGSDDEIMPPPAPPPQVGMAAAAAAAQRRREVERLIAGLRAHSPAHDVSEAPNHVAAGAAGGADAVDGNFGASTVAITAIASNSAATAAAPGCQLPAVSTASMSVTVEAAVAETKDAAMALPTPSYPRLGSSVRRTALPYAKVADAIIGNPVMTSTVGGGGSDAVPELTVATAAPMSDDAALLPPPPPPPPQPPQPPATPLKLHKSRYEDGGSNVVRCTPCGELKSVSDAPMQLDVELKGMKVEPTATEVTAAAAKATRVTSAMVPPAAVVTALSMTKELHVDEAAPPPPPPQPLAPATPMRKHNTMYGGGGSGGGGTVESSRRQPAPRVGHARLTHGSMGWGAAADGVDSDGRTTTTAGDARCRGDQTSDGVKQRCVEGRGGGCEQTSLHEAAVAEAPPPTPTPPPPPPTAATLLSHESTNRQRPSRHIRPSTRYAGHEFITLPVRRRRREVDSGDSNVRVSDDCHGGAAAAAAAAATCTSHCSLRSQSAAGANASDTASEVAAVAAAAERAMMAPAAAAAAVDVEAVEAAGSNEGLQQPYCSELRPVATTGSSPTAAAAENAVAAAAAAVVTESAVATAAAANVAVMTDGTVTADAATLPRSRTRVAPPPTPARLSKCSRTTAATAPRTASAAAAAEDAQSTVPAAVLDAGKIATTPAPDSAAVNVNVTTPTPTNPTDGSSVRTSWRHVERILEILKRYEGTAASSRAEAGGGTGGVDLLHRGDGLSLAAAQEILLTEAPAVLADGVAAVRQRYLELSVAVHPDKCRHPRAADAFAALTRALAVARRAADTTAAFRASCTTLTAGSDILDDHIASSSPGAGGAAATTSATIAPLYVIEDDGTIRIPAAAKKPTMTTAIPNSAVIRTSGQGSGAVITHGQDLDSADLSRKRPYEDFRGGSNDTALNAFATAVSVPATSSAAAGPLCTTSRPVRLRGPNSAPDIRTRRLVLGLKISDAVLRTIAPELPWPSSYGSEVGSQLLPPQPVLRQPSTSLPQPPPQQQQQQQQQQPPQPLMDTENECMPYMIVLLEPFFIEPAPKSAVAAAMATATAQCTTIASSLSVAPGASAPPDLTATTAAASAGNANAAAVAGAQIKPVTGRREPIARQQPSAAAAVTAAVTTAPATTTPAAAAAAISLERSWRVVAPEVTVLPALRRLMQLSAALAAAAAPAAERSGGHAEAQHDASVASAMEEEAAALRKIELRAAVLMPCRTALRGGFPLNGTYFQTNELFVVDHTAQQPLRFRLGQLLGTGVLEPCLPPECGHPSAAAVRPAAAQAPVPAAPPLASTAVYFGHATSSITRDMTAADVAVLFEEGAVCVRGFCTFSGSPRPLPTFLGSPSSLGHAAGRRAQSRTDGGNRRRAIDAEKWEED